MTVAVEEVTPVQSGVTGPSRRRHNVLRRAALAGRPVVIATGIFAVVVGVMAAIPEGTKEDPFGTLFQYGLQAATICAVALAAALTWLARRHGRSWDADVLPGLIGGAAALSLLGMLHGTPWGPGGLSSDQSFRTESITRFADTWSLGDFTYHGLPSFYAPAYFWVLGRTADLAGIEPWRMVKAGNVAVTMFIPLVGYLMWRRLVPARVAALICVVPVIVQNFYEPYAWLVLAVIVPWWLEAVHGLTRPGLRPRHPVVLGLIGAVLFLTYYYFFFVAAIALVGFLVIELLTRRLTRARPARIGAVLGVAAAGSAVYWLPLALSILRAPHSESLANRWFPVDTAEPRLPFLEVSIPGVVALVGLAFLALTARKEPLSRALAVFLGAAYVWYLIGLPAAIVDKPLLTFRGGPLIPLILLSAGVLGAARLAHAARARLGPAPVTKLSALGAVVLVLYALHGFTGTLANDGNIRLAHDMATPGGRLPRYHSAGVVAATPVTATRKAIDARYSGTGHPVVLTDRFDLLAVTPYYGFVQSAAVLSHPAGEFHARIAFVEQLAASKTAAAFARSSTVNRFDRIDVFVLKNDGSNVSFTYVDDNFPFYTDKPPYGFKVKTLRIPSALISPAYFDITRLDGYLIAVRR